MTAVPPPHWPPNVAYLDTPVPSRRLPRSHILTFCSPDPSPPPSSPHPPPRLAIRPITDPSHPAFKQNGLFNTSKQFIPRGTWIRDYLGEVHTEEEANASSDYDLSLLRTSTVIIGIDATFRGNESRFINDFRGVPGVERPNAVFELRRFALKGKGKGKGKGKEGEEGEGVRMSVWAGSKGVEKNEEILVSYGRGFWEMRRKEMERNEEEEVGGEIV